MNEANRGIDPNANPESKPVVENLENNPDPNTDPNTDLVKPDETKKTAEELAAEEAQKELFGKPESYEYKDLSLPKGMELNQEVTGKFNEIAQKLNLSQTGANELMNLAVELTQQHQSQFQEIIAQQTEVQRQQYEELLIKDKEIGGSKLDESLRVANLAFEKFADEEAQQLLINSGLNVHPKIVKMFHTLGKLIQDDSIFQEGPPSDGKLSRAQIFYPEHTQ